ncbi:MAG: hypothetical protein ABW032_05185 [Burkholderiaceae bacterium]
MYTVSYSPALDSASGSGTGGNPVPPTTTTTTAARGRYLSATQIQASSYRARRLADGRPIPTVSSGAVFRLNAALGDSREGIYDQPANVQAVLDEDPDAFFRHKVTRHFAKKIEASDADEQGKLGMAMADTGASDLAHGGTCGELTARTTTRTALEGDERMKHMFHPGVRPSRYSRAAPVPSHHYALLQAGRHQDPERDLIGDGLSRNPAMFVVDTNVSLNEARVEYTVVAGQAEGLDDGIEQMKEVMLAANSNVAGLVEQARGGGLPRGQVPFATRPSIMDRDFQRRSARAIAAMPDAEQTELVVNSAMQEVPGLTPAQARVDAPLMLARATAGR